MAKARGIKGAVAKKLKRFLVDMGNDVKWIISIKSQITIEARMKCRPFFSLNAQSYLSSSKFIFIPP
jgi:hypothetical protein